mmetsp:Transcript_60629/g.169419  ORF Transcript_60629/g.169419 Transcript_60629/m.169419 type:complete len:210 (-) Transcript_60629:193-822(-)
MAGIWRRPGPREWWTRFRGPQHTARRSDSWWGASGAYLSYADTEAERIARWGLRMNLENTYLSWTRNSIIATVAGCAMIQYKVKHSDVKRMPISGVGFLLLGFSFMTMGSMNYLCAYWQLRTLLKVSTPSALWIGINGLLPPTVWISSVYCFLNGAPELMVDLLETMEDNHMLPRGLQAPAPSTPLHTRSNAAVVEAGFACDTGLRAQA